MSSPGVHVAVRRRCHSGIHRIRGEANKYIPGGIAVSVVAIPRDDAGQPVKRDNSPAHKSLAPTAGPDDRQWASTRMDATVVPCPDRLRQGNVLAKISSFVCSGGRRVGGVSIIAAAGSGAGAAVIGGSGDDRGGYLLAAAAVTAALMEAPWVVLVSISCPLRPTWSDRVEAAAQMECRLARNDAFRQSVGGRTAVRDDMMRMTSAASRCSLLTERAKTHDACNDDVVHCRTDGGALAPACREGSIDDMQLRSIN